MVSRLRWICLWLRQCFIVTRSCWRLPRGVFSLDAALRINIQVFHWMQASHRNSYKLSSQNVAMLSSFQACLFCWSFVIPLFRNKLRLVLMVRICPFPGDGIFRHYNRLIRGQFFWNATENDFLYLSFSCNYGILHSRHKMHNSYSSSHPRLYKILW